jgi:hypothetical protein
MDNASDDEIKAEIARLKDEKSELAPASEGIDERQGGRERPLARASGRQV